MLSTTFSRATLPLVIAAVLVAAPVTASASVGPSDLEGHGFAAADGSVAVDGSAEVAAAAAGTTVTLPRHTSNGSLLQLLGVSSAGIAARQSEDRLLAGPSGARLTLRGRTAHRDAVLVDNSLTWSEPAGSTWVLHRVALSTGADTTGTAAVEPVVITPDGYVGLAGDTLTHYLTDGTSLPLLSGVGKVSAAKVDGGQLLVGYKQALAGSDLVLVNLTGGAPVWRQSTNFPPLAVELSATSAAWAFDNDISASVHVMPRAGGRPVGIPDAPMTAGTSEFALAGNRAAWPNTEHSITVLTGRKTRTVTLPGDYYWGIEGFGKSFYVGVGGANSVAGIYRVGTAGATRIASLPNPPATISSWTLSSGALRYNDDTSVTGAGHRIWQHRVTGYASPVLSKETRLKRQSAPWSSVSFSAGRGAVTGTGAGNRVQLLDRGVVKATLPAGTGAKGVKVSGPYAQVGEKVYRSTGALALDLTGIGLVSIDLYGKNVVYARTNGEIWWWDLARKASATNPSKLTDTCSGRCEPVVRIWGSRVAYLTQDDDIVVRSLTDPQKARVVDPGVTAAELMRLSVREGTLLWATSTPRADEYQHFLLNLKSATSTPVPLDLVWPAVDGRFAAGLTSNGDLAVQRLPFGGSPVARLIGTVAPASFSPNGDGRADVFRPAFDTTKPLRNVRLRIYRNTVLYRTLKGTGPDGSIRDLSWDGLTGTGAKAKAGVYTWTLTANSIDGHGVVTKENGVGAVQGKVRLVR
jgi:hypothetical protein